MNIQPMSYAELLGSADESSPEIYSSPCCMLAGGARGSSVVAPLRQTRCCARRSPMAEHELASHCPVRAEGERRHAYCNTDVCRMELRWLRGGSHGTVSPKLPPPFVLDYGGSLRLSPAIPTHCLAGPSPRCDDALFHPADAFSVGLQRAQKVGQAVLLHRKPAAVLIARRVDEFLASGRELACACVECSGQRRLGHWPAPQTFRRASPARVRTVQVLV